MLELKNISKSFGEITILKDFSYKFEETGIVTISGPSGVGKTTLFRMILGLEKQDFGEIIKEESMSISFQEPRLFNWLNVRKNLEIINNDSKKIDELLELAELKDYQYHKISKLSGGMKQRLSFIRAILYPSKIVLLDEPFKELDEKLHEKLLNYVKQAAKNRLFIIITHDKNDFSKEHIELTRL